MHGHAAQMMPCTAVVMVANTDAGISRGTKKIADRLAANGYSSHAIRSFVLCRSFVYHSVFLCQLHAHTCPLYNVLLEVVFLLFS